MNRLTRNAGLTAILTGVGLSGIVPAHAATPGNIDGRWNASLTTQTGVVIPFRLDLAGSGGSLKGTLYDGFDPYETTTSATFAGGQLTLNIDHYLTTITATEKDGQLSGTVVAHNRSSSTQYAFHATRYVKPAAGVPAPSIAGSWVIPLETPSSKGEKAFRFIVKQNGPEVAASILRVDGDTGAYSGTYQDGKWVLSHFDGSRPGVIIVTPESDGTLQVLQNPERPDAAAANTTANSTGATAVKTSGKAYDDSIADGRYAPALVAYRSEVAQAKGLPEPENYTTHTTVRDPDETFTFNFPDVDGHLVSNDDPRFKGKVVLAIVTGTWCPNCHDEAQYLVKLDKKYHNKGLAIVALDFEEPEQQGSLARERAFVKQYGVKYTYLIAGAPAEMWEKVPQAVNLNTWPATFFIGRNGKVRGVHSGFASPASGEFNRQLQKEFTTQIEALLAEPPAQEQTKTAAAANRTTGPG
jgi:thiol-disulfide isomerase/thioredoxin